MRHALGPLRHVGGRRRVELRDPLCPGTGVEAVGLVEGEIELTHGGSSVSARGWLRVPIRLECSRCLVEFVQVLQISVNEECALEQVHTPEAQLIARGKEGQIPILNEEDVDLSELVRQLVAMEVPSRPLCRDDCAGLCPRCGRPLSSGPCPCGEDEIDPRWSALRDLKL